MNSVQLIGRLVRDPDVRYIPGNQMAVANFTIAIDRPTRAGEEKKADFPRITVFGRQAETCEKYLRKGLKVAIEGRIQTGSYQNKNGDTVYTTDVVASRVEFLEWGDRQQGGGPGWQSGQGGSWQGGQGGYQQGGYQGGQGFQGGGQQDAFGAPAAPTGFEQQSAPQQAAPQQAPEPAGAPAEDRPDSFQAIEEDVPF